MAHGTILDIDGTLLQSNDAHAKSWVQAYADHGREIAYSAVRPLIGMGGSKVMAQLTPDLSADEGVGKEISEQTTRIFETAYLHTLQPQPGARALLEHLRARGFRLVVATSSKAKTLEGLLQQAGIADLIEDQVTASDVDDSKPEPQPVELALKKLGMEPAQALMLGDTEFDVESARKVGVGTVALRCGGSSDEVLRDAVAIYDDPADVLAHFDSSPFARQASPVTS